MMRQGKVSPRETNQTIVWHSQTFSAVKPESREREERTGVKLPFTEPCGNGLLRFHNWDGTQLSATKGEIKKKKKEKKKKGRKRPRREQSQRKEGGAMEDRKK
jgi:hypothetical protein